MRIVNKNNGRVISEGRFELSKVDDVEIESNKRTRQTWVIFRYFCDNLIKRQKFDFLYMVAEVTGEDSFINIEANYQTPTKDIVAEVQLTSEEREKFFVCIINYILNK